MADKVIRNDIIQLDFKVEGLKSLTKLQNDISSLKKTLTGGIDDDAFEDLGDSAEESVKPLKKVKETAERINKEVGGIGGTGDDAFGGLGKDASESVPPLEEVDKKTKKISKSLMEMGEKAAVTAFNGLKKLAGISFKAVTIGIGTATTAIGGLVAKSVSSYADYEQLVGGVDTLFKKSSKTVQKYANDAYKTAGLSANQYMDTVTSFSAAMIQSVGGDTAKAAQLSDMAIKDMSDNANKMGTDMDSIIQTYQSLSRGNFAMLDNLKLGYGGTKEELGRLIKDASRLDKTIKANDTSFGNISKAIHAVQSSMGITGTTAKEASETISGSLAAVKATWGNLMPALIQGGDSFDQCVNNLVSSIKTFGKNVKPAVLKALSGVGSLIEGLAPVIEKEFPALVEELLPPLIKAGTALFKGFVRALPKIAKTIAKEIPNILKQIGQAIVETFGEQFPAVKKITVFISENFQEISNSIKKAVPAVLGVIAAFKAFKKLEFITSIFGKLSKSSKKGSGGFLSGITKTLKNLAKVKTKIILKGMGNLAIIFGGFSLLSGVFAKVSSIIAKMSDIKSVAKLAGIIGVLGTVGSGLAELAKITGKIPIGSVIKGIGNIALALGGLSLIAVVIGAVASLNFDNRKIIGLSGVMAALGTVGSALAVLAGIVGKIPISAVVSGLAGITVAIGGMTALIEAFGALSEIPGFDDFISSGGDALANLFKQIGKIGGSLVGGVGEGITSSLPEIGKNITEFVRTIKPIFSELSGVDMSGASGVFTEIGKFILMMTANDVLSFFSGGPEFDNLGKGLNTFAVSSKGFFEKVAEFPIEGLQNAKALFQSLSDIGNIPNTGGVAQWFSGTDDFANLANGLKLLSSDDVMGFYRLIGGMNPEVFTKINALFQSFSDIGNIPNTGGIGQWFSGEDDISGLASKLPPLGEAMASFYNSIKVIEDFSKISRLFEALEDLDNIPNTGGLGQLFSGKDDISGVGIALKNFGNDTKGFFELVNGVNADNLTSVFYALSKMGEIAEMDFSGLSGKTTIITLFMINVKTFFEEAKKVAEGSKAVLTVAAVLKKFFNTVNGTVAESVPNLQKASAAISAIIKNISLLPGKTAESGAAFLNQFTTAIRDTFSNSQTIVNSGISKIVLSVSQLPRKMANGIRSSGNLLRSALASVWSGACAESEKYINRISEGAKKALNSVGSVKSGLLVPAERNFIGPVKRYDKGTNGHKGGGALVNDGRGAELVQMPNGNTFIPKGKNVFIPDAPKGMKVLPADITAKLIGRSSPSEPLKKFV